MNSGSTPPTFTVRRPVDPTALTVIREVWNASVALESASLLVGATARVLLLEHVFGLPEGRATRDIDFAFAVRDWEHFQAIKGHLTAGSAFREDRMAQRLVFQPAGVAHPFVVDLIPFGGVESGQRVIAWPPDMSVLMNVAGYREALAAAVRVEVEPGLAIPVASIPAMAILKLFAWIDRGLENPKDALDLAALLRGYHEAGNQERIYADALAALEGAGYDIELGGAWLLGRDAAAIADRDIRDGLRTRLEDAKSRDRLAADMARALRGRDDAFGAAGSLLGQFVRGFAA